MSRSWLEELEARLEAQLEDFLNANPRQEELLAEQEARDRQLQLRRERLQLQQQAEAGRKRLLQLVGEIRCWQGRRDKARDAGATELAGRAEAHLGKLMEQGRRDWQALAELGQRFAAVERARDALSPGTAAAPGAAASPGSGRSNGGAAAAGGTRTSPAAPTERASQVPSGSAPIPPDPAVDLEAAWNAFETQQELEALRRRVGH